MEFRLKLSTILILCVSIQLALSQTDQKRKRDEQEEISKIIGYCRDPKKIRPYFPGKDFVCTDKATVVRTNPEERCANRAGVLYKVECPNAAGETGDFFDICFNESEQKTIYVTHTLTKRQAKNFRGSNNFRFGLNTFQIYEKTDYNRTNVQNSFANTLGAGQTFVDTNKKSGKFVSRGHLAPNADFELRYHKDASNFLENIGPKFQAVNAGNWFKVEQRIRELRAAKTEHEDFLILTGYFGHLELRDTSGQPQRIYLDCENKFSLPKFFFKMVKNRSTGAGVAYVTSNNPYADNMHDFFAVFSDVNCRNVCPEVAEYKNFRTGYTICCNIDEFKGVLQKFGVVIPPKEFSAAGLMPEI